MKRKNVANINQCKIYIYFVVSVKPLAILVILNSILKWNIVNFY